MTANTVPAPDITPLLIYFAAVLFIVLAMLGLSHVLGERSRSLKRAMFMPFESGIVPSGSSQLRFSVRFYLVAIFFVIFDIEAVFIFAWAIAFKETGWAGYVEILIFITVLAAALAYLWLTGALEWRTARQKTVEGGSR